MGYMRGGTDITVLCDISYANDTRAKASINGYNYLFGGNKRETSNPNAQLVQHSTGYCYSTSDGLGGRYQKNGSATPAAAKGYRPATKQRWSSSAAGTYYINRFSDGEIWVSSTNNSRTGTKISETSESLKWVFGVMGGAGGGGGSATLTASAGGGGGGGYVYFCILLSTLSTTCTNRILVGAGGGGGSDTGNGSNGGGTQIAVGFDPVAGNAAYSWLDASGGKGGYGGGNSSGGGGAGSGTTCSNTPLVSYIVKEQNGAGGGQRNNGGGNSAVNFNNFSPEAQQITYMTGAGGSSGGNSGGGGGGANPLGHGGNATAGQAGSDGMICAGGGGASYKAFNKLSGGKGGNGFVALYY